MRLRSHVALLNSATKHHVAARPLVSCPFSHRRRHASSSAGPENIAILGGGISGLASAHFISKEFPQSKITIYESKEDVGGWIKSTKVNLNDGDILLEHGPRTLRPGQAALPTAQLIHDLGITDELLYTRRDAPGARNRYLYYPDRLTCLPSPPDIQWSRLLSMLSSGLMDGAWRILSEPWQAQRSPDLHDESVHSFISRRLDARLADNLASAILHGIYAGDVTQLSAKTLFRNVWNLEGRYGSVLRGLNQLVTDDGQKLLWQPYDRDVSSSLQKEINIPNEFHDNLLPKRTSTFTFRDGLQRLPKKIEESLRANEQVKIATSTFVQDMKKKEDSSKIEVTTGTKENPSTQDFDLVISTLPAPNLTPTVTVMTVNLFYKDPSLLTIHGFGYLIPRSVPFERNYQRALGVIFDHDAVTGQDSIPGTKLTVMLGGHWWNGWEEFPDEEEGLKLAMSVVANHLGIEATPDFSHVALNRDCIPQYTVGYEGRMKAFAKSMLDKYAGRVRMVGSQFNGVGVNDCIRGAWLMARDLKGKGVTAGGWRGRSCGLERFTDERDLVVDYAIRMEPKTGKGVKYA